MADAAELVIVGAGIVGASTAYHLAKLGMSDVLVLDQGDVPETGGSTSHAPGGVFQTNGSRTMSAFAHTTVELLTALDLDGAPCFLQVGGLEVATTERRLLDLKRRLGLAQSWGIPARLVDPEECAALSPLLDASKVLGGFHTPTDGIAKPLRATAAMLRYAQSRGARVRPRTEVTGLAIERGRVVGVETEAGRILCNRVLIACGIWGPRLGLMAGVPVPLVPCEHQYAFTAPIPALAGTTDEAAHVLLRHQDHAMYFRQHGDGYGIGNYRHVPRLVDAHAIRSHGAADEMPSINPFTPTDFEAAAVETRRLLPAVGEAPVVRAFNGMFSFTPDAAPVLGESPAVKGLWLGEAVWITHGGGVGKALAEWLVEGEPRMDVHEAHIDRFHAHMTIRPYVRRRGFQQYVEVYDVVHPLQQMAEPRGLRRSPFHDAYRQAGAVFFDAGGWERPQWCEANGDLVATYAVADRQGWAAANWSPIQAAEHLHVRRQAGLFDLTAFTKIEVAGPGALAFLQHLCANDVDKPLGRIVYTAMLNRSGGIECDLTVWRQAEDRFLVLTGGGVGMHDLGWIRRHAPADVGVRDVTSGYCALGLWGPAARDVLAAATEDDVSDAALPYYRWQPVVIGYVPAWALRLSYVGELGYEIYAATEYGQALWETLTSAGASFDLRPVGAGCMDSLRIEKGYRLWGADIEPDRLPDAAGLGWAVRPQKGEFLGRDAVLAARERPASHRLACLTLDDPTAVLMGKEPVLAAGEVVGYVASTNRGYSVGRQIAYAWLPAELAAVGTELAIRYFDAPVTATVTAEPVFDPEGRRLRG